MKSGGPWNLKGPRPQAREATRDVAQKPDVSLGEWLNSIVQSSEAADVADDSERPRPLPEKPRYRRDRIPHDERLVRYEGRPYRDERFGDHEDHRRNTHERHHDRGDRWRDHHDHSRRHGWRDEPREAVLDEARREEARREEARRKALSEERRLADRGEAASPAAPGDDVRHQNPRQESPRQENPRREPLYDVAWRATAREPERRAEIPGEAAAREAKREDLAREEAAREEAAREQARRETAREEARREKAREDAALEERRLEALREEARREAARAREGLGDINDRLDELTEQLDRLALAQASRQRAMLARVNEPAELPKPEVAKPEVAKPEVAKPEPAKPEPAKPEPAKPELTKPEPTKPQLTGAPPPQRRRTRPEPLMSIDDAVAEITARQRVLDNQTAAPLAGIASAARVAEAGTRSPGALHSAALDAAIVPPASPPAPAPAMDLSVLEAHLRQITARIDALQPTGDIEKAIAAVRTDLAEIGRQLGEALPRRAVESLEIEVKALGERIDHSRQCRVDPNALAGLERGLAEVREALQTLTPAENLVGFDQTVKALAQKLDMIPAREDPSALQQLEAAIDGLRGVVSHVASNDTLARVAEDVRALASQVDRIANSAATPHGVSPPAQGIGALAGQVDGVAGDAATGTAIAALETRIDALTAALTASGEAGQAMPHDLEKVLAGLTEKLERVQQTNTDHAALAHVDDRIASLVQRFDASDARLGHLEGIERGLSDLLVHIDEIRALKGGAPAPELPAVHAIERDVAEIKQSERRTQDTLEAVQGIVEHLVDRLATIESNLHRDRDPRAARVAQSQPAPEPALAAAPPDAESDEAGSVVAFAPPLSPSGPVSMSSEPAAPSAKARLPIDPNLPPDHPLEPGLTSGRARAPSAAERIADSEAAIGSAKPPVISDAERPNFIAAARRAAQAAAWEPPRQRPKGGVGAEPAAAAPSKLSQNVRKLIVAGSVVLIVVGCIRIATRLFVGNNSGVVPQTQSEQAPLPAQPPRVAIPSKPEQPPLATAPALPPSTTAPALPLPSPAPAPAAPPRAAPSKPVAPGRQSMRHADDEPVTASLMAPSGGGAVATALPSWAVPDITGALPSAQPAPRIAPAASESVAVVDDKLPVTIGNAALRKAAMAGDPAAAYEVATRFAEGRGVLQNDAEAAHWLQHAADHGLAPAQFRLGGLYEKGLGVKKDLAKARDLYLAAAQQGNGNAMHNLAVLSAEGVNGTPDYDQAALWFRKAADHGIRDSQYNLGILYARGIGVKLDNSESYKWFSLAAKQGDKDAASKRDEIASRLDPKSLAAARLAVQNWSPEPQPDAAINVKTLAAWNTPAKTAQAAKSL